MSAPSHAAGPNDLILVKRAQSGDGRAMRLLIDRYQRKAFSVALGMLRNREDAMDAAQEAFVRIHRHLGQFKGGSSFYTWLYRILVNVCVDTLRRRGTAEVVEFDETVSPDGAEPPPGELGATFGTSPQRAALRTELAEKLNEALQRLPEKHRAIVLLREVEGMSYEDLARTLDIPKGTVMSRLFHARARLRVLLADYVESATSGSPGDAR